MNVVSTQVVISGLPTSCQQWLTIVGTLICKACSWYNWLKGSATASECVVVDRDCPQPGCQQWSAMTTAGTLVGRDYSQCGYLTGLAASTVGVLLSDTSSTFPWDRSPSGGTLVPLVLPTENSGAVVSLGLCWSLLRQPTVCSGMRESHLGGAPAGADRLGGEVCRKCQNWASGGGTFISVRTGSYKCSTRGQEKWCW